MSRSFLTGLNLNKNELLNARIQNLANPPSNPVTGQIYYDTDTDQINVWDGTAWAALAAGGNVGDQIQSAIDALTTDDIEEGEDNLYYLSTRARGDAAALLTGATLTNITITGDGDGLTITAENGVADSDTDDLTEGTTNLYFTDQRALDATASAYDLAGAASDVQDNLDDHTEASSNVHGVTGSVVGTTDTQDLSNKRIIDTLIFSDGVTIADEGEIAVKPTTHEFEIKANYGNLDLKTVSSGADVNIISDSGDILLDADGNVYKGGSATAGNQLVTQNNVDQYIGDETVDGSSGNTITDRIDAAAQSALGDAQAYADALVQGLNVKDSVRVAADTDIDIANATEVDGVTLASGDRVLLKNQSTATENGIYVFTTSLARAADADPVADELNKGSYVLVTSGTYAATGWLVSAYSAGVTTWTQFSAANEYTAGTNIAIASNQISFSGILPVANGGTNANTAAGAKTSLGFTTKYAENNTLLEPTSNVVTWVVTHGMASRDVTVQVFENSTYTQVEVDVARTNTAAVTLTWVATANVSADTYRVVVVG
jgi:hypothetical protein